jgi:3-oxoacyl-[acyl-carrier protein] reductase
MLAESSCRLALTARTRQQLEEVKQEILGRGGEAIAVPADLTRDEDIALVVNDCQKAWGTVDFLVNNAGWGKRAAVVQAKAEDWDQTLRLNLRAPMMLSRLVLPMMIAKCGGGIVNIGSVSGKTGEANAAAYAASKFGLIGFTQSLYEEVREYGIKVAVILPGFVDTPLIPVTKQLDRTKMIRAEDVAESVRFVLTTPPTCCPVEITLRPQKTPYR